MYQFATEAEQTRGGLDAARAESIPADHMNRKSSGMSLPAKFVPPHLHAGDQPCAQRKVQQQVNQTPRVVAQAKRSALTRKPTVQRAANGHAMALPAERSSFDSSAGRELPEAIRQKMESFFGTSFADVRVHVGAQATSLGALAFTHGSNLYFARGQYNPGTAQGQQLLGHELTHVVQQRAGRVPNPFGSGIALVQDQVMEAEADRMAHRAAAYRETLQAKLDNPASGIRAKTVASVAPPCSAIQRYRGESLVGAVTTVVDVAGSAAGPVGDAYDGAVSAAAGVADAAGAASGLLETAGDLKGFIDQDKLEKLETFLDSAEKAGKWTPSQWQELFENLNEVSSELEKWLEWGVSFLPDNVRQWSSRVASAASSQASTVVDWASRAGEGLYSAVASGASTAYAYMPAVPGAASARSTASAVASEVYASAGVAYWAGSRIASDVVSSAIDVLNKYPRVKAALGFVTLGRAIAFMKAVNGLRVAWQNWAPSSQAKELIGVLKHSPKWKKLTTELYNNLWWSWMDGLMKTGQGAVGLAEPITHFALAVGVEVGGTLHEKGLFLALGKKCNSNAWEPMEEADLQALHAEMARKNASPRRYNANYRDTLKTTAEHCNFKRLASDVATTKWKRTR